MILERTITVNNRVYYQICFKNRRLPLFFRLLGDVHLSRRRIHHVRSIKHILQRNRHASFCYLKFENKVNLDLFNWAT